MTRGPSSPTSRRGLVTEGAARNDYGVALTRGDDGRPALDEAGTRSLRRTPPAPPHGAGPERAAWDSVHDTEAADRLVAALFRLPSARRYAARAAVHTAVLRELPGGFPSVTASAAQLAAARAVLDRLTADLESAAQ